LIPEAIPLEIVFENDDLLIVNKPAGMVVHPAAGHSAGTLVHAVLAHTPDLEGVGGEQRPGVVHRLDKDTSGLILFAKNDNAHRWLQSQFRSRQVENAYLALVDGPPPTPRGPGEANIGRSGSPEADGGPAAGKGRPAVSEYITLRDPAHTLLKCIRSPGERTRSGCTWLHWLPGHR
jgi:23S rRNA pseudouridine1911/1915/1917 synthase